MSNNSLHIRNYQVDLPYLSLAISEWGPASGYPLIALHGWLDNLNSFVPLVGDCQWLYDLNVRFIAVDLAGHGLSGHRAPGQSYVFLDYVDDLNQLIRYLEIEKPLLLGHSMGGGIATIFAGSDITEIKGLILIESLGPLSNQPDDAQQQLHKHLLQRHRHTHQDDKAYNNIEPIIAIRTNQTDLSEEYVRLIIGRNMFQTNDGYKWLSDPRLRVPSANYLTHKQVESFVRAISCSTLLIYAEDGPCEHYPVLGSRAELLKDKQMVALTGGHHLHMTNNEKTRIEIIKYLTSLRLA